MQVRRRPFPLSYTALIAVRAGKQPDPRKGSKEGRGTHAPKMQPSRGPTTLYVGGVSYETVLEERAKDRAARDPREVTFKIPATDKAGSNATTKVVPFARYGRESAKLRAAGHKVPYGDAVSPGMTVQVS